MSLDLLYKPYIGQNVFIDLEFLTSYHITNDRHSSKLTLCELRENAFVAVLDAIKSENKLFCYKHHQDKYIEFIERFDLS